MLSSIPSKVGASVKPPVKAGVKAPDFSRSQPSAVMAGVGAPVPPNPPSPPSPQGAGGSALPANENDYHSYLGKQGNRKRFACATRPA